MKKFQKPSPPKSPSPPRPVCWGSIRCDMRDKKIFKTNTRKARNTRNTHGHLLYPLVFFRLKKRNGKIEENYRNTRKARNTHN
jgi:hypothetical protein